MTPVRCFGLLLLVLSGCTVPVTENVTVACVEVGVVLYGDSGIRFAKCPDAGADAGE